MAHNQSNHRKIISFYLLDGNYNDMYANHLYTPYNCVYIILRDSAVRQIIRLSKTLSTGK